MISITVGAPETTIPPVGELVSQSAPSVVETLEPKGTGPDAKLASRTSCAVISAGTPESFEKTKPRGSTVGPGLLSAGNTLRTTVTSLGEPDASGAVTVTTP